MSLYKVWNKIDDDQTLSADHRTETDAIDSQIHPQHNQSELQEILVRVGLQERIAGKVADEVFDKLGRDRTETITFEDFVSLIQSDATDSTMTSEPNNRRLSSDDNIDLIEDQTDDNDIDGIKRCCNIIDDIPTISNIDLHASHSGLFILIQRTDFVFLCFVVHCLFCSRIYNILCFFLSG